MKHSFIYKNTIVTLTHVFSLIFLESIFYFTYISQIEQNTYLSNLKRTTEYIFNTLPITNTTRQQIINELHNSTYMTQLYQEKIQSDNDKYNHNHSIQINFIYLLNILFNGYVIFIYGIPLLYNKLTMVCNIKWCSIMTHLISLIGVMALFEYIFFTCVVKRYEIVTNEDIMYAIVENLN